MNTDRSKYNATQALAAANKFTTNVKDQPNPYNLDASALLSITSLQTLLTNAVQAQIEAADILKGKVKEKDRLLLALNGTLGGASRIALASGASAAQLSLIGLARPAKPVRATSVPAPTELLATPNVAGDATLVWKRNGAPANTSYIVESSADGLLWEFVQVTTRTSATLKGFTVGAQAWFRVTATRANMTSNPSNLASVYAPEPPAEVALKLA